MKICNMIHLWTLMIPSRLEKGVGERLVSLLSPEEAERYQKIGHEGRQVEYLLSHALLRLQVSEALGMEPGELPLCWRERRKPVLERMNSFVSLTHKNGQVAAALAPAPVGIDLEVVEISPFAPEIVRRFFSEKEQESVLGLKGEERSLKFTRLWALKEALFKAANHPIETIFRETTFEIRKEDGVDFSSSLPDLKPSEWQFQFLNPRPKSLLALAVRSKETLPEPPFRPISLRFFGLPLLR